MLFVLRGSPTEGAGIQYARASATATAMEPSALVITDAFVPFLTLDPSILQSDLSDSEGLNLDLA